LYSCKTCFAKTGQLAGVCYGCAENCHDKHELVELYTKRNFCCDCGNSKFPEKCKLYEVWMKTNKTVKNCQNCQEKNALNGRNQYNENFTGIFCVCKKPYPPPVSDDGIIEDAEDMIQYPICEDWFHPTVLFSFYYLMYNFKRF
jgi:E3 ubiquitin-protein ligase UBR7